MIKIILFFIVQIQIHLIWFERIQSVSYVSGSSNILLVMSDDLTNNALKANQLKNFAKGATVFTNAVTPFPVCGPSRASILTGMKPDTLKIYNFERYIHQTGFKTMFKYFKEKGLETFIAGKIYHTLKSDKFNQIEFKNGDLTEPRYSIDSGNSECKNMLYCITNKKTADKKIIDSVDNFFKRMSKTPDKRFIAGVGFHRPHLSISVKNDKLRQKLSDPITNKIPVIPGVSDFFHSLAYYRNNEIMHYIVDSPSAKLRISKLVSDPKNLFIRYRKTASIIKKYYDISSLETIDNFLKIIGLLNKYGHSNNTHIVFCSDHGYQIGSRFMFSKNSLYPEATNVPLIIKYAGQKIGSVYNGPTTTTDIFATLIELNDPKIVSQKFSLVPILKNTTGHIRDYVISQYPRCQSIGSVQSFDCMTSLSECIRPLIRYMGYLIVTNEYRFTEWYPFRESRLGCSSPLYTSNKFLQIDTQRTGTDFSMKPIQRELYKLSRPYENLATLIEYKHIVNDLSSKIKSKFI